MEESFLAELLELAQEIQAGSPEGTEYHPLSRALGEAALHLLRHRLAPVPPEVVRELMGALESQLAAARASGLQLDPVVEAMCEMVLREEL